MPFETHLIRSAALAAGLLASYPALAANEPYGVWLNDTGRGAIEIKDCGGKLCGHVVWVKDTADVKGCGRQIIGDVAPVGGGVWDNGWIYSPEKKKNYNVEVTPLADGTLKVKGYAGLSFLSKTMIWTKAPSDLKRCGEQQAAATPPPKAGEAPAPESKPDEKAAPAEKAAPPADDKNVAEAEPEGGGDSDIDISDLGSKFGDVLKRDANGNCKLDLPWVKLDFKCDGKGEK